MLCIYINRLYAVHTSHQIFFPDGEQFSGNNHHAVIICNDVPIEKKLIWSCFYSLRFTNQTSYNKTIVEIYDESYIIQVDRSKYDNINLVSFRNLFFNNLYLPEIINIRCQ